MKNKTLYALITIGGGLGLAASFLEVIEYQIVLKNIHTLLACDLNSVFNCSPVLTAWQSSVFGFPNAMLCMVFFTTMLVAGIIGLSGGTIARPVRAVFHRLALFFLGFAIWFFWQSIFFIGALCILCLICFGGLLLLNGAWFRLHAREIAHNQPANSTLSRMLVSGADVFIWAMIGLLLLVAIYLRFR